MATLKLFLVRSKMVRLVPLMVMEPFSMIKEANSASISKRYSQLPSLVMAYEQTAVLSTLPCTICPSNLPFNCIQRSKFTTLPVCKEPRFVF